MRVIVLAVGRCRDRVIIGQWDDYARRLPWNLSLVEINDADGPAKKQREAQKLLSAVPQGALVIALDERGKTLDSRGFAGWIERQRDEGRREMALIIGGADGLDQSVCERADLLLSLGAMTWPHMMVRVMLLEQLYRAHTILVGHPYHRD
ncbi:MAG: 23S rRNA (pseudouridine(1915)-N(3))-methyltransferase RlmH [Rhodospirillaceae bacterium]|nr:23S rRNA (pseudouridine(1915)-N(3))-methyltransferase RlmH [Rhodospirillaceae bacterium]|tara:strand:+ start:11568 stop:12017 length:450 start_codon:yes stop_codon:yes gene_type:complete